MIGMALIAIAAGMLLVRVGWGGRRAAAALGWVAAAAGLSVLTWRDGAWGFAIGTTAGVAAALAAVLSAGWVSPLKVRRPAREAPTIEIPHEGPDIARCFAVFALVVPGAFVAAEWLAFGAQAIARRGGIDESDAVVLTLFLQPILWAVIMTVQMTRANVARMIAPPVVAALIGTALWGAS